MVVRPYRTGLLLTVICLTLVAGSCSPGHVSDLAGLGYAHTAENSSSPGEQDADFFAWDCQFPQEVAGLRLASIVSGESALSLMSRFLGPDIGINNSCISCYNSEGDEVVFWIAELRNSYDAQLLLELMDKRIKGGGAFSDYERLEDNTVGLLYYARFNGEVNSQEDNFYYRKENRVYWVSMRSEDSLALLQEFLDKF